MIGIHQFVLTVELGPLRGTSMSVKSLAAGNSGPAPPPQLGDATKLLLRLHAQAEFLITKMTNEGD